MFEAIVFTHEQLRKSKSDPPLVTDLDSTPMSEALSQPHSLFERLESPCTTDRFDRDFMRQDIKQLAKGDGSEAAGFRNPPPYGV